MSKKASPRIVSAADAAIGVRLREVRIARGVSQPALGQHLGISHQQVNKYERGFDRITSARLQSIAAFLKTDLSKFFQTNAVSPLDSVMGITDRQSVRLVRAYSRIKSQKTQHRMVILIESIAEKYE